MPPSHLPLAARSRVLATHPSSATVSHVLGLVQNGYLDIASRVAVSQIRGYSGASGRLSSSSSSSIGSVKSNGHSLERRTMVQRQSFRTYSASAAQITDYDQPHESASESSSTYHRFHNPSENRRTCKYKSSDKGLSIDKGITKDGKFFRAYDLPDDWSLLPEEFYSRLYNGAFQSAGHFSHDFDHYNYETRQLGSIGNLLGVFALFRDTAEYEDWSWLAGKLERLTEITDNVRVRQRGLISLIHSVRGYALAQLSQNDEAEQVLSRISYSDYPGYALPTTHSIASLAYVQMEDWHSAMKKMAGAIDRGVQRITNNKDNIVVQECDYPTFDFQLIKIYEAAVLGAGRNDDLVEFVRGASFNLRRFLINTTQHPTPYSKDLTHFLLDSLIRIGSPVEWWTDEFNRDSGTSTRKLGVFLFIALTRDRSKIQEAIDLLEIFMVNGTSVPTSAAIQLCSLVMTESTSDAWTLYQRVCHAYPNFTHHALSQAMRLAGQAGWKEEEKRIWDQLSTNYKPTFRDRLTAAEYHAYRGRVADTIAMLETRVGKDFETRPQALQVLFNAYLNANNTKGAESVLRQINNVHPQLYPYNALLQLFADQANVEAAVRLFDELSNLDTIRPDTQSYTSLISLFAHRRDPVNAANVFNAMQEVGIQPDAIAYAAMLNAEVENGDWLAAMKRYQALPGPIKNDRSVSSAILKALVLLSSPFEHVMAVFRRIPKPNRHAWASVIQSASDSGEMEVAKELYEEMDDLAKVNKGHKPDAYVYSILLHGYMRLGDGQSARAVYDQMLSREVLPSSVTYGMIVKSFAEARGERSLEQAHDFAINVSKQAKAGHIADRRAERAMTNQNIFSPLVVAHGRNQNLEMAQTYFELAQETNGDEQRESVHIYTQMMDVYRRAGDNLKVMEFWNKAFTLACETTSFRRGPPISSDSNVNPDSASDVSNRTTGEDEHAEAEAPSRSNDNLLCIPLSIALDSLSVAGKYFEVKRIWNDVKDAGFGFDAGNYNHLAVALARTGDVEGAFMVADQILLKRYEEIKYRKNEAMRESEKLQSVSVNVNGSNSNSNTNINENAKMDNQDMDEFFTESSDISDTSETPSPSATSASAFQVIDRPVEPTFGPPNRRHTFHSKSPFTAEARARSNAGSTSNGSQTDDLELEMKLLSNWRPSDILWKPSLLTINVLDQAYGQLENAKIKKAWLPLTYSDEAENENECEGEVEGADGDRDVIPKNKKRTYGIVLPLFGGVPVRNHFTGQPHRKGPTELLKSINRRYSKLVGLIMFHRKKRAARKIRDMQGR
ncbi:uncharacterized protein I303_103368 [Kwoniella dejecticola CBS 10117]|uniref:Pentacotripeptide-repeat region of PRORP domain-containing protein n=1 Tax=Kwoniella dejecticola CBS 10117 TaxID=1296121 RepID=A0A1A6A6K3_9TREE|nr:uncharacterized protein I303_03391 [Kwoniella dejecticola CBS 10117]OBR85680.1 hypothetical protein I303_03391 [Kwoniella dejecticola CBS 10117]